MSVVEAVLEAAPSSDGHIGLKDQTLRAIASVASEIRKDDNNGARRAKLVELVAMAYDAKLKRKQIAAAISGEDKAYEGLAGRYIHLARWHMKKYRKGETPLSDPVMIAGQRFLDPVEALKASVASWSAVYNTFRFATKPQMERKVTTPDNPRESAKVMAKRISMSMTVGKEIKRVKISENKDAFSALLQELLNLDMAKEVLGAQRVNSWKKQIG